MGQVWSVGEWNGPDPSMWEEDGVAEERGWGVWEFGWVALCLTY